MRILGIDPGYSILGWAVIEHDLDIVAFGTIKTTSSSNIEDKLLEIYISIKNIIEKYQPDCASIEKLYFAKNTKTAIDVAKCAGVVLLTLNLAGLRLNEYSPLQVKRALTGYGRATKSQIQKMIMDIFKIKKIPEPDDAADALAIAACHSFNLKNPINKFEVST